MGYQVHRERIGFGTVETTDNGMPAALGGHRHVMAMRASIARRLLALSAGSAGSQASATSTTDRSPSPKPFSEMPGMVG